MSWLRRSFVAWLLPEIERQYLLAEAGPVARAITVLDDAFQRLRLTMNETPIAGPAAVPGEAAQGGPANG